MNHDECTTTTTTAASHHHTRRESRMKRVMAHLFPSLRNSSNNPSCDRYVVDHNHSISRKSLAQISSSNNHHHFNHCDKTSRESSKSTWSTLSSVLKYLLNSHLLFRACEIDSEKHFKIQDANDKNTNTPEDTISKIHHHDSIIGNTNKLFVHHFADDEKKGLVTAAGRTSSNSPKHANNTATTTTATPVATTSRSDPTSHPGIINKFIRSFQGNPPLSTDSIQAFNNILFLVNSIPPSVNSVSIFDIMLRSSKLDSDLLPFLAQVKIPKSALGGTDYKTFISTLSRVQMYLPSWYYNSLVLAKALGDFDSILLYCAQRFAREIKVQKAITGALIYPAIMTTIGLLGITLLLTRILPQNIAIFESMGLTVPAFLQWTNYLVRSVQYHWLALLYIIPSTMSSEYLPFKSFLKWQYIKMHTPLGNLKFLQDKATLLHTLSLLDKEQITSKLLIVCSNISSNPILQHMVESMASLAKYGAGADDVLAYMLKQKHIFSPYEIAYLQACFMSGKHSIIQDGLKYASQMILKQYTQQLQTLLKILNPATVAIIGVLVIVIAVLGIYPMIALTGAVTANK
ncbi:hypothetical protein FDP41_012110 [Naegleria fowleri]|uniref:Type II secretion system protein GspF domain-containing protein n=1 Tax=Naegleria fowleri TaxID=5763 RepID=A0A6A5BTN4_NAEFO|nr:uncharacterized protein FDP41_012110 [Naegleria fowleri]KAF0981453.1 hypothetical protein FDP41_012110 [Naegleria fowleri]